MSTHLPNPSDELKIYELSLIWKEAAYNFAFWQGLSATLDWDKAYKEALPAVLKTTNIYDYYLELMKFVALLRDGHTDVQFPSCVWESAEYTSKLPIHVVYFGGNFIIGNVKHCAGDMVKRWSIIKKINGVKIQDYLKKNIFPYIWHEKLDSMGYQVHNFISNGPLGSVVELELDYEGEIYTVKLERTKGDVDWLYSGIELIPIESLTTVHESDSHKIEMTGDNIAVITINTMENDNLPEEFYASLPLLEKARGYVIDIRYNGGGNSSNGDGVASAFLGAGFKNGRSLHPIHIGVYKASARFANFGDMTWEEVKAQYGDWAEKMYKIPRQEYYEEEIFSYENSSIPANTITAPLVVLTTANTGSAAEDFLIALEHAKRATFVGTATYGSTGQPLMIDLESGGRVRICTRHCTHIDGREFINIGVLPHVHFEPTLEDWKTGKDTHMAKGLEVIRDMV